MYYYYYCYYQSWHAFVLLNFCENLSVTLKMSLFVHFCPIECILFLSKNKKHQIHPKLKETTVSAAFLETAHKSLNPPAVQRSQILTSSEKQYYSRLCKKKSLIQIHSSAGGAVSVYWHAHNTKNKYSFDWTHIYDRVEKSFPQLTCLEIWCLRGKRERDILALIILLSHIVSHSQLDLHYIYWLSKMTYKGAILGFSF